MKLRTSVLLIFSLAQILLPVLFLSFRSSCNLEEDGERLGAAGINRCEKLLLSRSTGIDGSRTGRQARVTPSDVLHSQVSKVSVEEEDLEDLRLASSGFNLSDTKTRLVVQLVKKYTEAWTPIPGGGQSPRSSWTVRHVREAILSNAPLACCAHVRVVEGKVFFRYGLESLKEQFRLDRANDVASFLQATVDRFRLRDVRVELLFNTCDHALSREGMMPGDRSNFLIWTPHVTEGVDNDVVVPDLLDLRPSYMQSWQEVEELRRQGPAWEHKLPKAVFRGATTNYRLTQSNWVSSPRLRLHRMTEGMPDRLDAGVTRWSHISQQGVQELEENNGILLASLMNDTQKNDFKYELIVDGGLGGGRLCGVLLTDRTLLMQSSPFFQFFYPLLKRGRHFMETQHSFHDLADTLAYMQSHDDEMRNMVDRVHQELGWTCSIQGRMLAFAVLLVKYHRIQDPFFYQTGGVPDRASQELIKVPQSRCKQGPARDTRHYRDLLPSDDRLECPPPPHPRSLEIAGCPHTCFKGLLETDWHWLSADDLQGVPGMDWWKTHIPDT